MRFGDPQYFHFLWLVPFLAVFLWMVSRRRKKLAVEFAGQKLLERLADPILPGVSFLRAVMLLLGLVFLVVALARPQYGKKPVIVKREGRDIIFLLDTSTSMLADDLKPDRLTRARFEISSLLTKLEGDRVGLVPFAGDAFVLCPLTTDYSAISLFLDGVDTDIISEPGTNIARALEAGAQAFDQKERKYRVMVLITDGEELEGNALDQARKLRQDGIRVYTIGIGTPDGVPIPVKDSGGKVVDYKKDSQGQIVMSRLGEGLLVDLARAGGGEYYRAGRSNIELDRIFEDIKKLEKRQVEERELDLYYDRYQWFLGMAILLLFLEPILWESKRKIKAVKIMPQA